MAADHVGQRRRRAAIGRHREIDLGQPHELDGRDMAGRAERGRAGGPLVRILLRRGGDLGQRLLRQLRSTSRSSSGASPTRAIEVKSVSGS